MPSVFKTEISGTPHRVSKDARDHRVEKWKLSGNQGTRLEYFCKAVENHRGKLQLEIIKSELNSN